MKTTVKNIEKVIIYLLEHHVDNNPDGEFNDETDLLEAFVKSVKHCQETDANKSKNI